MKWRLLIEQYKRWIVKGIVQGMGVIDNMDNTKKPVNTGFPQLP